MKAFSRECDALRLLCYDTGNARSVSATKHSTSKTKITKPFANFLAIR